MNTNHYVLEYIYNKLNKIHGQAIDWYYGEPVNATKYRGDQRRTLPVILHYDIVEGNSKHDLEMKQFKTTEDLTKLRRIAEDRDKWKELSKIICSIA